MTQTDIELKIMNTIPYPPKHMINDVCINMRLPFSKIKQGPRHPELVMARRFISYFLHEKYGFTLTKIGDILNKDHSTIIYHVKWIKERMNTNHKMNGYKQVFKLINNKYEKSN